jgi:hypothetical protein
MRGRAAEVDPKRHNLFPDFHNTRYFPKLQMVWTADEHLLKPSIGLSRGLRKRCIYSGVPAPSRAPPSSVRGSGRW